MCMSRDQNVFFLLTFYSLFYSVNAFPFLTNFQYAFKNSRACPIFSCVLFSSKFVPYSPCVFPRVFPRVFFSPCVLFPVCSFPRVFFSSCFLFAVCSFPRVFFSPFFFFYVWVPFHTIMPYFKYFNVCGVCVCVYVCVPYFPVLSYFPCAPSALACWQFPRAPHPSP